MGDLAEFLLAMFAEDPRLDAVWREVLRQVVEEHGANRLRVDPCDAHDANFETVPCDTLRFLALPYADRPGFREEWKP